MSLPDFAEFFSGAPREYLLSLLQLAVMEDGPDLTSDGIFSRDERVKAVIVAKEPTIVAGLPIIPLVMDLCATHPGELAYTWQALAREGERVDSGTISARIVGPVRQVLRAERVILNMVSRNQSNLASAALLVLTLALLI